MFWAWVANVLFTSPFVLRFGGVFIEESLLKSTLDKAFVPYIL